jgi:long-chain acyl-CoA synthetase
LTEASPVTHANPIWGRRKNGSIGLPFPDTEAKVVDSETGEEVPQGEVGELIVRGPQVMRGYWNQPEESDNALRDGWLYTGDMATMDEDGYFYIVERKKDVIVASGFNVYPREVEEVLYEHEAVKECTVAGIPDEYRGETVKAYIVLKEKKDVSAKELEAFCRERLAAFKVPRKYEFRDELPKALTGKVLRRVLVEEEKKRMQETRD